MAFTLVHHANNGIGSGTNTTTVTSTTAGNLLVIGIAEFDGSGVTLPGNPTTPTNWTAPAGTGTSQLVGVTVVWAASNGVNVSMFYYPNCPAGITSVAIPVGANTSYSTAIYGEFSGAATAPFDQAGNKTSLTGVSSLATATAAATAQASELAVHFVWNDSGNNPETITLTGWSAIDSVTNGSLFAVGYGFYETTGAAGVITATPTWTDSVAAAGLIATFEAPAAGGQTEAIRMII